ncbi:DNA-binding protein [Modestobacter sp. Leaf380]|uniref:DNA-binding protein n=1 Tax=Modestobacter sp. Leaf380 TaxID=1736356 RepID=UPI0006FC5A33|nr:DNA-binding protein [Modestobacter sp. Leaf380]KQS66318.1 hypothetical protein ASG41_13495 [Modestobacter sp. Leaf380]
MTQHQRAPGLPLLYTVEEVARALRCSEHYVRTQARAGRWPHVRMAREAPHFTVVDVEAVLELHRAPAPASTTGLVPRSATYRRRRAGPNIGV